MKMKLTKFTLLLGSLSLFAMFLYLSGAIQRSISHSHDPSLVMVENHALKGFEKTSNVEPHSFTPDKEPPKFIYFLKIPKCGGTSLAIIFQGFAKKNSLKIASPGSSRSIATCQGRDGALEAWEDMASKTGGHFDVMISHGCFKPFMLADKRPDIWGSSGKDSSLSPESKRKHQLTISLFRDPW